MLYWFGEGQGSQCVAASFTFTMPFLSLCGAGAASQWCLILEYLVVYCSCKGEQSQEQPMLPS